MTRCTSRRSISKHPTLAFIAENYGDYRSLFTGDALVLSPVAPTLLVYARDALPPDEWREWLADYEVAAPRGPDGSPDFVAYRLPEGVSLPTVDNVPIQGAANFANVIVLEAMQAYPATSGDIAHVDMAWTVLNPAPYPDIAVVAQVCDRYGWCWVKADVDGTITRGENSVYNATQWQPGEQFITRISVPLPHGMPTSDDYRMQISLFSAQADAVLPAQYLDGGITGPFVELGPVSVAASDAPDLDVVPMMVRVVQIMVPGVTLAGYDLPITTLRPGERLAFALHWSTETLPSEDTPITITLGETAIVTHTPVGRFFPRYAWEPHTFLTDRYDIRLPTEFSAGEHPLVLQVGDASVMLGTISILESDRNFSLPNAMFEIEPMPVFGEVISLPGYLLGDGPYAGSDAVDVRLVWRAESDIRRAFTVFVHLLDADENIVAQADHVPFQFDEPYPTDLWIAEEVIADDFRLRMPADLPPGEYRLRVGLYDPATGVRLVTDDGDSVTLPDMIEVR